MENESCLSAGHDTDVHIRIVEDLADLIADRIIDALNVEFGGEGGLHAVDDGEFGVALFGDLEQALGLVEETRILERHAHTDARWSAGAHLIR